MVVHRGFPFFDKTTFGARSLEFQHLMPRFRRIGVSPERHVTMIAAAAG
jgi:hypothetical protein